ncbi:MAG: hypothetical protein ROO73_05855 [Roseivirga sp.]
MPTQKPRIGLTLAPETATLLGTMAQATHQSTASLAKELLLEALEDREDITLSALAEIRSIENKVLVKHSDVWQ